MKIGQKIKQLRTENNIPQKDLANKLNISQALLSYYESDSRRPSYEVLVAIADFFDTTTDYLLGRED
ncbi:MAG: hypothetical protein DBX59_06250 [Bacillota bacterium]|nr:MAG: hypothetical protein DBX59_06250 [Bacillota bacterium]